MKAKDVEFPSDTIEASLADGEFVAGRFVDVEIQGDRAEYVRLTKEDARAFGAHLIALSEQI